MSEARVESLRERGTRAAGQVARDGLRVTRTALEGAVRNTNAGFDRIDALHRAVMTALRGGLQRLDTVAERALDRAAAAVDALERAAVRSPPAGEASSTRAA